VTKKQFHNRKTFYIIDGHAYMYRSYYAIRGLSTAQGKPTNALYGFTSLILKLLREQAPDLLAVTFDSKGPTKRHETFPNYKSQRKPMPEDLIPQMAEIQDILKAFHIPIFQKKGYEADDILATLAKKAEQENYNVFIVTGDKDLLQLVNDHIRIVYVYKDNQIIDEAAVKEKYGFAPQYMVDFLGMAGDVADNIPGVPGVGIKTATSLVKQFGTLEDVIARSDEIKSPAQRFKVKEYAEQALLSKRLVILDENVPDCDDLSQCQVNDPDARALRELFHGYQFYKFMREMNLSEDVAQNQAAFSLEMTNVDSVEEILCKWGNQETVIFFKREGFLAFKKEGDTQGYMTAWASEDDFLFLMQAPFCKCSYDLKPAVKLFQLWGEKKKSLFDLKLGAYLLYPGKDKYPLEQLTEEFAQVSWLEGEDEAVWGHNLQALEKMYQTIVKKMKDEKLWDLYKDIEEPLTPLLAQMEAVGVKVDAVFLDNLAKQLEKKLSGLTKNIYKEAGVEFNINSPKQISKVLFEDLKLPPSKKTKTGYSTNVDILEKLAEDYILPELILSYRQYYKLKTTYMDALPKLINSQTGRIHTTLQQDGTATGRLSSSDPNLQNIPIRTQEGREIRKAFIPGDKNSVLVSADYSQIELRVLAHLSEDENMKEAFQNNVDIHRRTAAQIMGLSEEDVTEGMRRMAKAINFGLIYGKTPFGLSKDLNIPIFQAKEFINAYFANFPRIRTFMDETIEQSKKDNYVRTMYGRVRHLPDINAKSKMTREFAERMAINSPVQGAAADIIKMAMLKVDELLRDENFKSQQILQIHDELLFEVPKEEVDCLQDRVCTVMQDVVNLSVPLVVNISFGDNWAEAH
jgi:DNA polymerase-1